MCDGDADGDGDDVVDVGARCIGFLSGASGWELHGPVEWAVCLGGCGWAMDVGGALGELVSLENGIVSGVGEDLEVVAGTGMSMGTPTTW